MRTLINCLTSLFAPGRYTKSLHERNFTRASPSLEDSVAGEGIASVYEAFCVGDVTDAEVCVDILKAAGTSL